MTTAIQQTACPSPRRARQGARRLRRGRRPPAHRRDRPRQRVRRRDAAADPVQGRGADADHGVVAATALGRHAAPPDLGATRTRSCAKCRRWPRPRDAGRPRHALSADERLAVECVVRGYLSGSAWKEYRASAARWRASRCPQGSSRAQRLDPPLFSPGDQGRDRARREHHVRRDVAERVGAEAGRRRSSGRASPSTSAGATLAAEKRHHHRGHEVRVRPRSPTARCS